MQLILHALKITNEQFEQVVRANSQCNFEQTADGELVILPLLGETLGRKKSNLTNQLGAWVDANLGLGEGFDSGILFVLPNGAKRSFNAFWVSCVEYREMQAALGQEWDR